MPSYLITGANGSLGFEFIRQLSANPDNKVVGIVRNTANMQEKLAKELPGKENVFVVKGDLADYKSLAASAEEASKILGGKLDYLIANAAYMGPWAEFKPLDVQSQDPETLTAEYTKNFTINTLGNIHLFNAYLPLLRAAAGSEQKKESKVIVISTGMADTEMAAKYKVHESTPYSIAKAALNMAVAKFHAGYSDEGILFMAICPGVVLNDSYSTPPSEEKMQYAPALMGKFATYAPHFTGPTPPDGPVRDILRIAGEASIEGGWGGSYTSHNGGKQWL